MVGSFKKLQNNKAFTQHCILKNASSSKLHYINENNREKSFDHSAFQHKVLVQFEKNKNYLLYAIITQFIW